MVSCHVIENQETGFTKGATYTESGWPFAWNPLLNCQCHFQSWGCGYTVIIWPESVLRLPLTLWSSANPMTQNRKKSESIRGQISYTQSVERKVCWIRCITSPFCFKTSGPISITSWSREKRYQALRAYTIRVPGEPGNEAKSIYWPEITQQGFWYWYLFAKYRMNEVICTCMEKECWYMSV